MVTLGNVLNFCDHQQEKVFKKPLPKAAVSNIPDKRNKTAYEPHSSSKSSRPEGSSSSHHGSNSTATAEPKQLSNTQLKKQKVREWRRKQKQVKNGQPFNELSEPKPLNTANLVKEKSSKEPTRAVAIDCEMVGVDSRGSKDMLARVSIVNLFGHVLYDKYVLPMEKVTDYRTFVSGITPENLQTGTAFFEVQKEVCEILKGRVLVGHAIKNDLRVLYLDHPKKDIRDTSRFFKAAAYGGKGTPSLRKLTEHHIGVSIQGQAHDSVEDARATMRLYTMFKKEWEAEIKAKFIKKFGEAKDWSQ